MVSLIASGCGAGAGDADRAAAPAPAPARALPAEAARPAPAERVTGPSVIILGDSLTAGLGLDVSDSFPARIQRKLDAAGYDFHVVNAGVSGDTSAGALRRLDWALGEGTPRVLVVALGGNDGLRGLPPEQLEANLSAIIARGRERGLTVILAGMEAPPNFGADYTTRFRAVYPRLAERHGIRLIPFLLEGVAGEAALNQGDGIHPNARGAEMIADLVWASLQPELARAGAR